MRVDAVLKAHPPTSNVGVRSAPVQVLELKVTEIDPLDPGLAERLHFEAPLQMKQAFAYTDYPIAHGMYLVVAGKEYAIKGVGSWADRDGFSLVQMVLEDVVVR